ATTNHASTASAASAPSSASPDSSPARKSPSSQPPNPLPQRATGPVITSPVRCRAPLLTIFESDIRQQARELRKRTLDSAFSAYSPPGPLKCQRPPAAMGRYQKLPATANTTIGHRSGADRRPPALPAAARRSHAN